MSFFSVNTGFTPPPQVTSQPRSNVMLIRQPIKDAPSPLHQAAGRGNIKGVQDCLDIGISVDFVNQYHMSALMSAVTSKKCTVVQLLLQAKANVNYKLPASHTSPGYSALHFAASSGDFDAIRLLTKAKADLNLKDGFGATAYDLAQRHVVRPLEALRPSAEDKAHEAHS